MKIELTSDGSNSLRHPILGELYHSDRGAIGEAMHVYIGAGFDYVASRGNVISVFEVGFGSGLNAWLTLQRAAQMGLTVDYHCIELYPIDMETAYSLNFTTDPLFMDLHRTPWGEAVAVTENFTLTKHLGDWSDFECLNRFDVVYYDAFAPDIQPELWGDGRFAMLHGCMSDGGVITTYTAKGTVKQAMRSAGFVVQRLVGALGKRHMLRAVK